MSSICSCISNFFCCSRPHAAEVHSVSMKSLSLETADKVSSTMKPVLVQLEENSNSCSICLEEFTMSDKTSFTSCEHTFHTECFDRWAAFLLKSDTKTNCPNCRNYEVSILVTS